MYKLLISRQSFHLYSIFFLSPQILSQIKKETRLSEMVRTQQQEKLNNALQIACRVGSHKVVIPLVQAGATNFQQCIESIKHVNHIAAFLRLCQAAHEDDRPAIQLFLEQDDDEVASHPRYAMLRKYHQILIPLLDNGKLSIATPIQVALKAKNVLAAGQILLRFSKHPSSGLVDWHGLELQTVPEAWLKVLEYRNLHFMSLSFNKLKEIPVEISNFKNLVKIQVASNEILIIPSGLLCLPKLEYIDVSYNTISALPEPLIGQLSPCLSFVNLANNRLSTLPSYFENAGIKHLDLSNNRLQEVPKCVCTLKHLESLNIDENIDITHLPYELGSLRNLELLSVDGLKYAMNIPKHQKGSTLKFIQKRFKSMQTVTHYEVVLIGFQGHRKHLEKLSDAFKIVSHKCTLLRFDSPTQFLYLHQVFKLPDTVYIVTWDCENQQDANELHSVLRHLSVYASGSPVVVAACWESFISHSDLAVETNIANSLWKDLDNIITLKHVVFENSDVPSGISSVHSLTKVIAEIAEKVRSTVFVPGSYYHCIEFLQKACKKLTDDMQPPLLNEWDFWELVRSMPTHDLSGYQELPHLVAFLTNMGALLHAPCTRRGSQSSYIICRQWFCQLLYNAISFRHDTMGVRNFSAVVRQEGLIDLLESPLLQQPLPDALRHFVHHRAIALALSTEKWLVSSMLAKTPDQVISEFTTQYDIRRQYTFSLTPISFWGRLITHLLINLQHIARQASVEQSVQASNRVSMSTPGMLDWTYWSGGIVCWQDACTLMYSIETIGTRVRPFRQGFEIRVPNSPMGCRTMQILMFTIDSLLSIWYPTIWQSVEVWVPCSYCLHKQNPDVPLISFRDCLFAVAKGVGVKCTQHPEKIVSIGKIVPDLVEEDVSKDLFLPPNSVEFNPHDKSSCLSPPPFETVFKGWYASQIVAIKPFPQPVPSKSKSTAPPFLQAWLEAEAIRHIQSTKCQSLLDMVGICPDPICIVFPFAMWCSLEEVIQMKELAIPHLVRIRMVYQLASALNALHSCQVIHRNVCLANILVYSLSADEEINIKLGGFSKACYGIFQGVAKGCHGIYPAPEMFEGGDSEYDERVDIFAFGFVAYEIIMRGRVHLLTKLPLKELSCSAERPSLLPIYTRAPYLVQLLDKCWDPDSSKRPFASEVVRTLKDPLHMIGRDVLPINEHHEFFSAAAKFTRVQNSFLADVFVCSGPLNGEGTTLLSHLTLPGLTLKNCTSLPSEFVICMCCIGPQLWVSYYGKKVRVYSSSTLEFINEFKFQCHVVAMAVSPTSVYLGLENGVLQIYDVSGDNVPTEPIHTKVVCQGQKFKCIEPLEDSLVCATRDTLFRLHPDTLAMETKWSIVSESEIRSIAVSEFGDDEDTLWISFRRLDHVEVLNAWNGKYCYTVECSRVVPFDPKKVWVLTMQVVLNTVWIGLNTGHILVFLSTTVEPCLLTHFQVHQEDVRHLLLLHPSYMGPKSILSANDKSPEESLQVFPESVDVLSFGQGLHESLPVTSNSGTLVPCKHSTDQKGGLFAVVLEGMTDLRTANLEKNCDRNPVAYMHYLNQEEDPYDTQGMELPCENATPTIPRTDTWSASTSFSPIHTSQKPNSLEESDSYTSIEPVELFARTDPCSYTFSDEEDGSLNTADVPPPLPPRTHLSKLSPQPIIEAPSNSSTSSIYHPATELFQQNVTPGQSSDSNLQPQPISRLHTAPNLLDSSDFGSFEPYVRMDSVVQRQRKIKESPPVPHIQQFLKPEKPPPIPPRASNRHK